MPNLIAKLKFKGNFPSSCDCSSFEPGSVTIFVGPNHSGKSKLLKEIHYFAMNGFGHPNFVLLDSIDFANLTVDQINVVLRTMILEQRPNETVPADEVIFGDKFARRRVPRSHLIEILNNSQQHLRQFCEFYVQLKLWFVDSGNRSDLVKQETAGDLLSDPSNYLDVIFRNDELRARVRDIIYAATGYYFVIDPTNLGNLRIRFSQTPPISPLEERGLHQEAVDFHRKAVEICDVGDGFKAFTGIVSRLAAGNPELILIDEPEAYMHPPLAYHLGAFIGAHSKNAGSQALIATHSSRFLMGCISSGAPLNIVRLTYQDRKGTVTHLNNEAINELMRLPLIRSTNVLDSLFYDAVVVTESDSDRVFYQEINDRLLSSSTKNGISNCLFLNAQNKHTIPKIVKPLRSLGVKAIAVVDIDVINDENRLFADFLDCCHFSANERTRLEKTRAGVYSSFNGNDEQMKKRGVDALYGKARIEAEEFFAQLAKMGMFVVTVGELECWLKYLNIRESKRRWISSVFERMGSDPSAKSYVHPTEGDVWAFISQIAECCRNLQ